MISVNSDFSDLGSETIGFLGPSDPKPPPATFTE